MHQEPSIEVVETRPSHLHDLSEVMHPRSVATASLLGVSPKKALWESYRRSIICMTALIDGRVAAIWGLGGTVFNNVGKPWLVLSPEVEEYPFIVCFRYRKELNKFQEMYEILEEWVEEDNIKAVRLLQLMGFVIDKNKSIVQDTVFLRAERRAS